jgi:hypothetical protein
MYKSYHVIGFQRTGTNWLNELIKLNFHIEPATDTFWKHLTPAGTKRQAQNRGYFDPWGCTVQDLYLKDHTFYIATSKEWPLLLKSINRNAEDIGKTHAWITRRKDTENTKRVYDAWCNWRNQQIGKDNFYWCDYLDWLNNWQDHLKTIQYQTGWKRKYNHFLPVQHSVPRNENFDINNYIMESEDHGQTD